MTALRVRRRIARATPAPWPSRSRPIWAACRIACAPPRSPAPPRPPSPRRPHTPPPRPTARRVERRARRFQVGLAAALLVLTTVGGLGATYVLQQRQEARRAVRPGAGQGKGAARPGEPPGRRSGAWRDALAALERVEGQGPEVEVLRDEIQAGMKEAERGIRLRQELVEIRANQEDVGLKGTDAAYATAFRDAGLDLDALEPAEFARRLTRQPEAVVIEVSAFLDDWSAVRRAAYRPVAAWRKPMEAARLADPDPYRDRLRTILLAEDRKPQAEALTALAAAPEAAELPAPTAVRLGQTLAAVGQAGAAVALLRAAAGRHPGDVWVNYTLAGALDGLRRRGARRRCDTTRRPAHCVPRRRMSWATCSSGWAAAPRPRRSSAT